MILYDPHDWYDHLLDIKGSMLHEIVYRVLSCVLWSVAVVVCHKYLFPVNISYLGHMLIGVAMGLLLVFRTNASYDRFWEGRKLWGAIVNESRNLARASSVWMAEEPRLVRQAVKWTITFSWATLYHLRAECKLGPEAHLLPEEDVRAALASDHCPLTVALQISRVFQEARRLDLISDYKQAVLDHNVQLLIDYLGGCERIRKTPLPFAYMVHLRRTLIIYCFTMPFALLDVFGWGVIPATLMLTYVMFGIEEIGVEIEDPFGNDDNDLPLEAICQTITSNLNDLLENTCRDTPIVQ